MIFNIPLGGSSYINVTAPAGSSISASCSGVIVTGSGSCILEVPIIGTWSVSCTYDSTTKIETIDVTTFGSTYSVSFTYSCGIVIYTVGGAAVTLSQSGQTSQTKNASNGNAPYLGGSASFTVPKKGSWNVSAVYTAASDMVTSQSTSVAAVYDDTKTYSCNPRYYIYRYGNVDTAYYQTTQIGTCGITTNDSDGHGAVFDPTNSHGYWRVYKFENTDGGMATMFTTQGICLRGFSRVGLTILRASNARHLNFGLVNTNDKGTSTSTWRARTQLSGANSFDLSSEATYYVNFSTNETLRPVIYLLGGYITFRFWFVE